MPTKARPGVSVKSCLHKTKRILRHGKHYSDAAYYTVYTVDILRPKLLNVTEFYHHIISVLFTCDNGKCFVSLKQQVKVRQRMESLYDHLVPGNLFGMHNFINSNSGKLWPSTRLYGFCGWNGKLFIYEILGVERVVKLLYMTHKREKVSVHDVSNIILRLKQIRVLREILILRTRL